MILASLLAVLLPQAEAAQAIPDQPTTPTTNQAIVDAATPEARAAWTKMAGAARSPEVTEPITAFLLEADVLTRDGVRTNELQVRYRYLAPHFIRFRLPKGRETGRGPGDSRNAYWVKNGDEVTVLAGREWTEDRRLVDDMLALARNFVALSDPARIPLTSLATSVGPPGKLPLTLTRRYPGLVWLEVGSPAFALTHDTPRQGAPPHRASVGIDAEAGLPRLVVIRPEPQVGVRPTSIPQLIELAQYLPRDGYLVPHTLKVHIPRNLVPLVFEPGPNQEVYLLEKTTLKPELTEADFQP